MVLPTQRQAALLNRLTRIISEVAGKGLPTSFLYSLKSQATRVLRQRAVEVIEKDLELAAALAVILIIVIFRIIIKMIITFMIII